MNSMDVLLSRLTWPSALVRERAAVALAELISQEGLVGDQARNALLAWIGQQNLESTAALGIIVLCRLSDQHPDRLPELSVLDRKLRRPSLLSFELLQNLYETGIKPDWTKCHSGTANSSFESPEFFEKFRTNFLPPIYSRWMKEVQDRTMLPMFRQWAFEWMQLVSAGGYHPSERVFDFGMRPNGPKIIADFPLSEVYRSAYLRSLAWAVTSGKLSEEAATFLALESCPIDLGLWRVQPGMKPAWWHTPKVSAGAIDTVPAQVWAALSSLWERRHEVFKENALLAASGRVLHGSAIYNLSIRAMFQVAHGPVPGDLCEMMQACEEAQGNHSSRGAYFGGTLDPVDPNDISLVSHDCSILPASVYVQPHPFPRWQYWRGYRGIQLPASFLASSSLSFQCEPDSVKIFNGTTQIGLWRDWTDGVMEEFVSDEPHPHGWVLEASWDLVYKFAHQSRSTLGWICELKLLHREHEYRSFREFSTYQLYGTTNLVLPP